MSDRNEREDDARDVEMSQLELPGDFLNREANYNDTHGRIQEITLTEAEKKIVDGYIECEHCRTQIPYTLWWIHDCQDASKAGGSDNMSSTKECGCIHDCQNSATQRNM